MDELIQQAAKQAMADGIGAGDDSPGGPLANWIRANCAYRPESEFYLVLLIGGAIADLEAQAEGFASNADRAAKLAFADCKPRSAAEQLAARIPRRTT